MKNSAFSKTAALLSAVALSVSAAGADCANVNPKNFEMEKGTGLE